MDFNEIYKISSPFTMTSLKRMEKLHQSVVYVNENNIEGSFVECGVYKGGSVMNMALTQLNYTKLIHIYLFDTFEGMTPRGKHDIDYRGKTDFKKCICSLDEVKKNVALTNYPQGFLHYRKGDVKDTLQKDIPEKIAILRLDTDWYESTKIELEVLYPKLVSGGILILDDYGYWKGARKAVDEYFASNKINPKFEAIDEGIGAVSHTKI